MNECPKCKELFADSGFCPHDGSTLIARADPAHSDDVATHGGQGTGTLTGSAVEHVLKKVVETRKVERLIGIELDGRYKIEKQIGEGGMGVVFLARHMVIEKAVAIKVLRAEVATDEAVVKRFVQEARAASRIGHPNIIDVTDFGTTKDGLTYQVMEYLEGKTLARLLGEEGTLDLPRALSIMAQMARALGAAHNKGIVHRDLKPENVFLMDREGRADFVKIVDFGIAKVQPPEGGEGASPRLTRVGTVFGTPEYMSPEQASGRTDVDLRADIYALGVILYEMLCGRVPHRGETTVRTLAMQMLDEPLPMREARPDLEITNDQEAVVMRSLAKKRDKRYQNMAEFLTALEEVTTHTELDLPRVMEEERRLSGEQLSQRAFDTVPEAEVEDSMRSERSTSAHELAARAGERDRPRRASRATDPVFLRENRASAMPQYDVLDAEESGPIPQSDGKHIWPVLITLLLVGGALAAFVLTRGGDEVAERIASADYDAAIAMPAIPVDAMAVPADAAALIVDAAVVTIPDARRRHTGKRPDKPDNTVTPPSRGTQEIKIYTEPSGAELFIGNTYHGPDGLRMRRAMGTTHTVTCHLKGYLDGSVKVKFDGKRSIYECKLKKRRVKKCVEGTKNPFDDCP